MPLRQTHPKPGRLLNVPRVTPLVALLLDYASGVYP